MRQLGLLQLHADPFVQSVSVGPRVEPEDPDVSAITPAQAFHALDRGGLARAVRAAGWPAIRTRAINCSADS